LARQTLARQVKAERENRRALPAIACEAIQQKYANEGGDQDPHPNQQSDMRAHIIPARKKAAMRPIRVFV
jgi:hypothetical protein